MDFIKKSINTIDNAIEINKLKDLRAELSDKRIKMSDKIKKYDFQADFRRVLEQNVQASANTIAGIKQQFFLDNIEITETTTVEEFYQKNANPYFISLFHLYVNTVASQKVFIETMNEIDSHLNIDKGTYQTKLEELDKQLESTNAKLKKVRDKQFK
jgi:hypothetical protein